MQFLLFFLGSLLSSKVLQLAGSSISVECDSNPVYKCNEFRITSGGSSKYDNIVHFVPPTLNLLDKNLESLLVLIDSQLRKSSVAIPAIGTGKTFAFK